MEINKGFFKWIDTKIPYGIAKVAQTKDGFMGLDSDSSVWITGDKSREHAHTLRSKVDSLLIGRNTALIDNPQLTVREVMGNNPKRIILDTNRILPLDLKIFNDSQAETIVLFALSSIICAEILFKDLDTVILYLSTLTFFNFFLFLIVRFSFKSSFIFLLFLSFFSYNVLIFFFNTFSFVRLYWLK